MAEQTDHTTEQIDHPTEQIEPVREEVVMPRGSSVPSRHVASLASYSDEILANLPPPHVERRARAPRSLKITVGVLFALTVAGCGALVALHERPAWFKSLRNFAVASNPTRSSVAPHHHHVVNSSVPPSSITTGGLQIGALQPSSGPSGTEVTIVGTNLVAPGGYLVATFNGVVAPTHCPSEQRCIATVPAGALGSHATVRLANHSQQSNPLTFTYR